LKGPAKKGASGNILQLPIYSYFSWTATAAMG
jgi:hypothetical protein